MSLSVSALRCTVSGNAVQNTMWVGNKQFEHNIGKCNNRNTARAMQVRHAKVQARFSGNDESGKGLQQLEHVCVLVVIDTRTAEARGVGLQRAEGAVPSGKWVLSLLRPGFET